MNKQPVRYMQTDARWKATRYPCTGGTMSIGGGGCGPTSAAMLIETLTGKPCPPTETMQWACSHGYVVAEQGTRYECFAPLFKAYGLSCGMIPTKCLRKVSPVRTMVEKMLQEGYYFIALMVPISKKPLIPGTWTKSGHFVVVWWADDKIRINDPASTSDKRNNGDPDTFFSEAKYFWWVDARAFNNPPTKMEDEDMTYYETVAEVEEAASWAKDTVIKLIDRGYLKGTSDKKDEKGRPAELHLSADLVRTLVILDRAGAFGK